MFNGSKEVVILLSFKKIINRAILYIYMLIQIVTNINNKLSLVWETHDLLLRIYYLSISKYVLNNRSSTTAREINAQTF